MRRRKELVEGQRYRKRGPGGAVWEVVSLRRDVMGAVHALLMRFDDPKTLKTLSAAAVLDPDQFERVDA